MLLHKIGVYIAFTLLTGWLLFGSWQLPQPASGNYASHQATNEEGEKLSIDRRIARYTFWLAGFTAVLAFSTIGLWIATGLALRHARETAQRQLRAYVHVADATILHANDEWSPNIRIKLKNYGQTPAYRVINRRRATMVVAGKPPTADSIPEEVAHFSDLGPSQDQVSTLVIPRTPWQLIKTAIERRGVHSMCSARSRIVTLLGIFTAPDIVSKRRPMTRG
jgi:hypothetical protein